MYHTQTFRWNFVRSIYFIFRFILGYLYYTCRYVACFCFL